MLPAAMWRASLSRTGFPKFLEVCADRTVIKQLNACHEFMRPNFQAEIRRCNGLVRRLECAASEPVWG